MAAKLKKKNTIIKKGKKKWAPIYAPAIFGEVLLGESYVFETTDLQGKYLTANLSTITKNMRKQTANVQFKVVKIEEGKGKTEIIGYSMVISALKRLVRRGRDKIADSFICKTNDKKIVRVKPLLITGNYTTKMIQSACRLETRRVVREFAVANTVEAIIQSIVDGKLQKIIKDALRKIYPIKSIDIRMAKLVENTKIVVTDKEVVSEPVKKRKLANDKEAQTWKEKKELDSTYVQQEDLLLDNVDEETDDEEVEEVEEEPVIEKVKSKEKESIESEATKVVEEETETDDDIDEIEEDDEEIEEVEDDSSEEDKL